MNTQSHTPDIRPTPARPALAFALLALGMIPVISADTREFIPTFSAFIPLTLAALFALGASVGPPPWRKAALIIAAITLGLGWATFQTAHAPADFLGARLDPDSPPIITLEGVIVTPPTIGPAQRAGALARFAPPIAVTRFRLSADTLITDTAPSRATGSFHVRIDEPTDRLRIGDRIRLTGKALPVAAPTNPGETDYRASAIQNRIAGSLLIPTDGLIEPATTQQPPLHNARAAFLRVRASTRSFIRDWIGSTTENDDNARALLGALLLGERTGASQQLHGAFARIGLAHLLSISGLHLVAVAWGALMLLRLLGDRPRIETIIVLLAVFGYLFIAPVRTPILRAAIMVIAFLAAELAGRRYHPLAILSLTAIAIILWKPTELAAIGFQLSFGIVAALIVCTPRIEQRLFQFDPPPDERTTRQLFTQMLRRMAIAAIVAWAIATPLIARHVGVVSPLAPILTVVLAPPVTILLTGALGAILLSAAIPPLAIITGAILALLASVITTIALFADSIPFAVIHIPQVSVLWTLAATLVIGWWCIVGDRKNTGAIIATLLMVGWTVIALAPPRLPSDVALRVDSLDVGDGSCLLVRAGSGAILFDAGSNYSGAGLRTIPRALRALGAGRIDTAIISHANLDHYNALLDAAAPIGLGRVLVSHDFIERAEVDPSGPVSALLDGLRNARVRIEPIAAGDTIQIGALTAHILSPPDSATFDEANDNSIVLRITTQTDAGDRTLLLTGDIEHTAMDHLYAQHPDLHADIAEAPHHGSAVTGSGDFLLRINPQIVLQSTGPTRLGDPRLDHARASRIWLTTARDGALWATINRDGSITSGIFIQTVQESSPSP